MVVKFGQKHLIVGHTREAIVDKLLSACPKKHLHYRWQVTSTSRVRMTGSSLHLARGCIAIINPQIEPGETLWET